jgi:carboxypeptidase Taq
MNLDNRLDNRPRAYAELESRFHRWTALKDGRAVLEWDQATMMPDGGAEARAEQVAALDVVCHGILADPSTGDLLAGAESAAGELDPWQRANLAEMRRLQVHATAVEPRLVEALARAVGRAEALWRKARAASDFPLAKPALAELLGLVREVAAAKAAKLGTAPYEALVDEFEPGLTIAEIDRVFDGLAAFLPALRAAALARQAGRPAPIQPKGPFPVPQQQALAHRLMEVLGFVFDHGRLDTSHHPFCGGVPEDVRITTRYSDGEFVQGLMGVLHETGHALYERGRPTVWRYQPVGLARGMAIHESQSLLVEMQVCRGPEFLGFLAPLLQAAFGGRAGAVAGEFSPDNLRRLYARVDPGFIRVEADEVCYPSHVILRYRLEKAMIAGALEVEDLPAAWNQGMRDLLGLEPPDDRRGCLQDIHWFVGAWGYFPTYTLGAMTAAQLYDAATRDQPGIPAAVARGDFKPLLAWLGEHIHSQASRWSATELLRRATGRTLDPAVFKSHLERRYLA